LDRAFGHIEQLSNLLDTEWPGLLS